MATDRTIPLSRVELVVTEAGVGGRPLLLAHGFTGARTDFENHVDRLADRGWHVVAPDQRGHGASSQPGDEAAYSFDIFASDLAELADALSWGEFALLGHSMGGMVAQVLALSAPERVKALVLMDTSHTGVDIDPAIAELGARIAREQGMDAVADVSKTIQDPLTTEAYRRLCAEDPSHELRGDRNTRASSPAMFASMITQIVSDDSRLADLVTLTMPTLVIVGDQDEPFLAPSRELAETIPDARIEVIPGAGHSPQFEAAEMWWAVLSSFLDEVEGLVSTPHQPAPGEKVTA